MMLQLLPSLKSNPVGFLQSKGINIPQNMNDPQQIVQYLVNSGRFNQSQINMANLAASQTAQTAQIIANAQAGVVAVEQYIKPSPIPAYVVPSPTV